MIVFPGGRLPQSRIRSFRSIGFMVKGNSQGVFEVPCAWQYKGAIKTISRLEKSKKRDNLLNLRIVAMAVEEECPLGTMTPDSRI